jgi:hypothetical protein
MPRTAPPFETRVDRRGPDECWPWTGPINNQGYGTHGAHDLAHRTALANHLGRPIRPGMIAMHTCDNPPCCNPRHLVEATRQDNQRDMAAKGRNPSLFRKSQVAPNRKIHPDQYPEIRAARETGLTLRELGERYCVHLSTIHLILKEG